MPFSVGMYYIFAECLDREMESSPACAGAEAERICGEDYQKEGRSRS